MAEDIENEQESEDDEVMPEIPSLDEDDSDISKGIEIDFIK